MVTLVYGDQSMHLVASITLQFYRLVSGLDLDTGGSVLAKKKV